MKERSVDMAEKNPLQMLAANLKANQWVGDWVCLSIGVTRVTIQLWQLSKQQEGQVMTQQTALAWLTPYILSASVSEVSVHVFVSFVAYVDRCLPAVQMASMLLPFSTCCLLETFATDLVLSCRCTPSPSIPTNHSIWLLDVTDKLSNSSEVLGIHCWQACQLRKWGNKMLIFRLCGNGRRCKLNSFYIS